MAGLMLNGLDINSRKWLLFDDNNYDTVSFDKLDKAIAFRHTEVERDVPEGFKPNSEKGGCAPNPLVIMEREMENYVLGRMFLEEPLGPMIGIGKAIEQRFHMRLGNAEPELVLSSFYEGGYLMFRRVQMHLSEEEKTDAGAVFVHQSDLNTPLFSVLVMVSETKTMCKCANFPCSCGTFFRSIPDLKRYYQMIRTQMAGRPWEAFTQFLKVMPVMKMRKNIQSFKMEGPNKIPLCSRQVYSHFTVVRDAFEMDSMKFAYVQDCIDKISGPTAGLPPAGSMDEELSQLTPNFGLGEADPSVLGEIADVLYEADELLSKDSKYDLDFMNMSPRPRATVENLHESEDETNRGEESPENFDEDDAEAVKECDGLTGCGGLKLNQNQDVFEIMGSPCEDEVEAPLSEQSADTRSTCPHCNATFKRKYEMQRHVKSIHLKEKRHTCDICDKGFFQKSHLTVHMKTVHERKKDDVCSLCGRKFATKYKVDRHIRAVHNRERTFKCEHCGSAYYQSSDLKRHINLQHEGVSSPASSVHTGEPFSPTMSGDVLQPL